MRGCLCSILNAREEKLLDGEGRLILRLICNACGHVLDSELLPREPEVDLRQSSDDGAVVEASS